MMAAAAAGSCAFVRAFSSGPDQPRLALALLPKYARATQGHRLPPRYAVQGPPRAPGLHMPVWVGVHGGGGHVRHVLSCRERCGVRRPLGACPHPRAAPGHPAPAPWPGTRGPVAPRWRPGVPGAARLSLGSLTGRRLDGQTGHRGTCGGFGKELRMRVSSVLGRGVRGIGARVRRVLVVLCR